jgi:hypothetical protein
VNDTIPHLGGEKSKIRKKINIEDLFEVLKSCFEIIKKKYGLKETRNNHLLDVINQFG